MLSTVLSSIFVIFRRGLRLVDWANQLTNIFTRIAQTSLGPDASFMFVTKHLLSWVVFAALWKTAWSLAPWGRNTSPGGYNYKPDERAARAIGQAPSNERWAAQLPPWLHGFPPPFCQIRTSKAGICAGTFLEGKTNIEISLKIRT